MTSHPVASPGGVPTHRIPPLVPRAVVVPVVALQLGALVLVGAVTLLIVALPGPGSARTVRFTRALVYTARELPRAAHSYASRTRDTFGVTGAIVAALVVCIVAWYEGVGVDGSSSTVLIVTTKTGNWDG